MPITFTVAAHPSNPVTAAYHPLSNESDLLAKTWGKRDAKLRSKEILQCSLSSGGETKIDWTMIRCHSNGFVDTVVEAYNRHHHLVLRPDDVWIAILGQFNFYVNAHAEELRSSFVQHKGKKELLVTAFGTRYSVDFGNMAQQMTEQIQKNVVDPTLKDWILPNFSTTTHNDSVICAVQMMSTLKAYFSYKFRLMCGIPSVTLQGEKSDWESLLSRLDKLASFGDEPMAFATLLRPILTRFVDSFTNVESGISEDLDFWGKICHYGSGGSGPSYLSGWITAFCVWDLKGKWLGPSLPLTARKEPSDPGRYVKILDLHLDGITYGFLETGDVPSGFCEVDVKLDDNGEEFDCMMVAGHVGSVVEGKGKDTLKPLPAWFMFVKDEE